MNQPPASPPKDNTLKAVQDRRRWLSLGANAFLVLIPLGVAGALLTLTVTRKELNEVYFVNSAYYVLTAMLVVYACIQLSGWNAERDFPQWLKTHRGGVIVTAVVSLIVLMNVEPAFRVLADEANLVGVSRNLFYQRTANFPTAGKWYFENFWTFSLATDRRPALFPYLVSLLHVLRGYRPENAFHLNAVLFIAFGFTSYRVAKKFGGELFGLATCLLVACSPNTLIAARSAGFDLLATLMLLVVFKSFSEYATEATPRRLAILALQLCMLAHVRYEGWALMLVTAGVLIATRMVRREHIRDYAYLYAFLPIFLLPRYWQTVAKANDAEQPLSATLFSLKNFVQNGSEYLRLLKHPLDISGPHSPLLMLLAIGGCALVTSKVLRIRRSDLTTPAFRCGLLAAALLATETVISFSYAWGKSLHPASCRLFIWLDTAVAFAGAWTLTVIGRQFTLPQPATRALSAAPVTLLSGLALLAMHLPVASEARFTNSLILTRQAAATWRYFERLNKKSILIMSDRPGLFTIMNYGALDISIAKGDRTPLFELSRHLYEDIYLVQEIDLNTREPLPAFNVWPDVPKETVLEFQNTDSSSVRIAKVKRYAD